MSVAHLNDLRKSLEAGHWKIVREVPADENEHSGIWVIARPDGSDRVCIVFEGRDHDTGDYLSIDKAYGCHLKEFPATGLYFGRISRSWKSELSMFLKRLDAHGSGRAS